MRYILLDYVREEGWLELAPAEQERWLGAYRAYLDTMAKAGVLQSATGLEPSASATTVRAHGGGTAQVLDGPYADTKEQLGGFHVIEASDLDDALAWAARSPTALHGVVEVRPIMEKSLEDLQREIAARGRS